MKGRRTAALLCVLLSHALVVFVMLRMRGPERGWISGGPQTIPISLPDKPIAPSEESAPSLAPYLPSVRLSEPSLPDDAMDALDAGAEARTSTLPQDVDWPVEGKQAVKRVLDAEVEAERVARMFSGPKGTWASLTPRDRSRVKAFRWKEGVVPRRDENGNVIVQVSEGCVLVNFSFIGCTLGKKPVHGDLFKDMRLYFDEQRMPESKNGNGR